MMIILYQSLMGLLNLHVNKIVHRDLCPGNIMLSFSGKVKLIDFGQCFEFNTFDVGDTTVGTRGYQSPELLDKKACDTKGMCLHLD